MIKQDFVAYLKWGRRSLREPPCPPPILPCLPRGSISAYEAFDQLDSYGKMSKSCRHPRVLQAVMYGKESLNFHITDIWGYSFVLVAKEAGAWLAIQEIIELAKAYPWLPRWVWRNLVKKIRKACPYWIGTPDYLKPLL